MIIIELIFNLSLLVAVSVLSGFIITHWKRDTVTGILLQGLLFGGVALLGMLHPFEFAPGVIFDGRSVVISVCTLFFGPVAGLIVTLTALIYRVYLGGGGLLTGISVIAASYLIGLAYYYKKRKSKNPITTFDLYVFGLLVHIAMVVFLIAMPSGIRMIAFKTMSFTILGIYPLATLLIGKILKDQEENTALMENLAASEREFRLLVHNMNQGMAVHEVLFNEEGEPVDYRFTYLNEKYEELTGFRKADVLGKTILEVVPKIPQKTIQKYAQVAITGKAIHFESYSREQKIYYEADIYQSSENHFAVILSDITLRKQAQREIISKNKSLEKINEEKDKLFSIVSHDLRSPMNGILGLTGMINNEIDSFSKDHIREMAKSIHTSASSIIQLLHGLLEWSQLQRGNINFNPQTVTLLTSVQSCIKVLTESAKAKNIAIISKVPGTISVYADNQMLESVIRNLVSNAIKFTPKGGQIEISASESGLNTVVVSVKDDGIGMNANILEKLFRLSAKINRKGTEGELSSGLGLILCKELIEKHGGKIWAESEENMGSTFYFTIKISVNGY
ncbi:MAG: ATP-binding protein [Bacteroidales bacterium]|nr:ATP-binding protein [Bacteroidales bacterium]